jgi:hypothetical protein
MFGFSDSNFLIIASMPGSVFDSVTAQFANVTVAFPLLAGVDDPPELHPPATTASPTTAAVAAVRRGRVRIRPAPSASGGPVLRPNRVLPSQLADWMDFRIAVPRHLHSAVLTVLF